MVQKCVVSKKIRKCQRNLLFQKLKVLIWRHNHSFAVMYPTRSKIWRFWYIKTRGRKIAIGIMFLLFLSVHCGAFIEQIRKKNLSYTLYFAFGNPALTGTKPDSENICTVESTNLKSFVCVSNNTDEQTQNNINEECDKDVEINLAEDPHPQRAVDAWYLSVRVEQIISIDHRIQTFCSDGQWLELKTNKKNE